MSQVHPNTSSPETGRQPAGQRSKYLTVTLAGESYGIPVMKVREIIRLCPITRVANMPPQVRGVINLRGKVIPVVDLRTRFGMPVAPDHDRTCIVVTQIAIPGSGTRLYGIIVDGVEEVASFGPGDLEPTPDFGGAIDAQYLTGIAKGAAGVKMLVDLDRVWAADAIPVPDAARAVTPE